MSVEQFGANLRNAKIAKVFYANLLDDGYFRDPRKSRFVMDAQETVQTAIAEAIIHLALSEAA